MRREIIQGLLLGTSLVSLALSALPVWHSIAPEIYGNNWDEIGLVVGFSLIGVVLWGTLSGSMLPLA